jgi:hypothetical protein
VALGAARAGAAPADADARCATLEHRYAVYCMSRFPVVATYMGGAAFDPALAHIDDRALHRYFR